MDLSPLASSTYATDRIPDGDTVPVPAPAPAPAPTSPPVSRRTRICWLCSFAILALGPIVAVARALWP